MQKRNSANGEAQSEEHKIPILALANKLAKDTNHFIKMHSQRLPTQGEYQMFAHKITARLRSRINLIANDNSWRQILGDVDNSA